jgi:hypothetical protein
MFARATLGDSTEQEVRRYIETAYCAPFDKNGWVYEDGALSIAAQKWLDIGGSCETIATEGEPAPTVSCKKEDGPIIECALLRVVRRSEVRSYIEKLRRDREVRCDDGTPVEGLGVP